MKSSSLSAVVVVSLLLSLTLLTFTLSASAREMVLPAGTILRCTLDEPNFSSATVAIGDPVLCRLHSMTEFGRQAFPRGSYLIGHLEAAQDPGHFWGKGFLKIQFDRIGLPDGDMPLDAKVIGTRGYKVDKYGDIDGKGHAKRDIVEWMIPPLWPWKIIMLPARGPRPTLKGESQLTLRLMDDVQMPQISQTFGPDWHFFGHPYNDPSYNPSYNNDSGNGVYRNDAYNGAPIGSGDNAAPRLAVRHIRPAQGEPRLEEVSQVTYATYHPATQSPASSPARDTSFTYNAASSSAPLTAASASSIAADSRFAGTSPGVPVFVLKTGVVLAVGNYTYQDGRISYELASGGSGVISTDEVDWTTTQQVNLQRGVRVGLRAGHPSSGDAGF
ncbi:MAG: hypothetical protein WBV36_25755 [Terriglobales bacterium]